MFKCKVEFTHNHKSINCFMNNKFQANDHQLALEIAKFGKTGYRRSDGCFLTNNMVDIKFIMVQVYLMLEINP